MIQGNQLLEYVRSWSLAIMNKEDKYIGQKVIYECPDGSFREQDGSLVKDPSSFKGMPEEHYGRAVKWLKEHGVSDTTEVLQ